MKHTWLLHVGLLLFPASVFGVGVPVSDMDWGASTLQVAFSPELGTTPSFSCFGGSSNPATASLAQLGFPYAANPTPPYTGELIWSQPSSTLDECFQQAGDYVVTLTIFDNAGNQAPGEVFNFEIKASNSDQNNSSLIKNGDCSTLNDPNPYANNSDTCDMTITLRDRFGNPISQLSVAEAFSPTAGTAFDADEANVVGVGLGSTNFRNGLRFNGSILLEAASGTDNIAGISQGVKSISGGEALTAIAPSVAKVGNYIAKVVERSVDFTFDTLEINHDGTLGSTDTSVTKTLDLVFKNPFELIPSSASSFFWEVQGTVSLDLGGGAMGTSDSRQANFVNRNPSLVFDNNDLPEDITLPPPNSLDFDNPTVQQNILTTILPGAGMTITDDLTLSASSEIQYSLSGETIQYAAGGIGFSGTFASLNNGVNPATESCGPVCGAVPDCCIIGYGSDISIKMVGADVEGGILGDKTKLIQQGAISGRKASIISTGTKIPQSFRSIPRIHKVLFFGRMVREKGVLEILIAAEKSQSWHFEMVGTGPLFQSQKLSNLTWTKSISHEQINAKIQSADIVLLPSWSESVSLALLEAAANKRAILATNVGENATIVSPEFLLPRKDGSSIAQKLNTLYQRFDLLQQAGENNFRRMRDQFSREKMIHEYEKILSFPLGT